MPAPFMYDDEKGLIMNPEAVKLIPEFSSLDKDELLFLVCSIDYRYGPYRNLSQEDRYSAARQRVFKNVKRHPEKTKKFEKIADLYKSLIFDPYRETKEALTIRKRKLLREIEDPDLTSKQFTDKLSAIDTIDKRLNDLDETITEKELEIKGGKGLSFLEVWQKNMKAYGEYKGDSYGVWKKK